MPPRGHQRGIRKKLRSGLNESSLVARAYLRLHIYEFRPDPAESMEEEEADNCSAERMLLHPGPVCTFRSRVFLFWTVFRLERSSPGFRDTSTP